MAIRRPDPMRAIAELQDRLNRLFDEVRAATAGGSEEGSEPGTWTPPVDLVEREDRFVLRADVPGVDPAHVHVEIESGTLCLRGERRPDPDVPRDGVLRAERPTGPFRIAVALPKSVEPSSVQATQRGGVLEIVMPKRTGPGREAIQVAVEGSST